jgi:hypothetical protein
MGGPISTQRDFKTMTDTELADYQYSHRDDPLGVEADLKEVEIAHPLSVSMSFRLPPAEAGATSGRRTGQGAHASDAGQSSYIEGYSAGRVEVQADYG